MCITSHFYAFVLLIRLCQFDFQTQPGTLRELMETLSSPKQATMLRLGGEFWKGAIS